MEFSFEHSFSVPFGFEPFSESHSRNNTQQIERSFSIPFGCEPVPQTPTRSTQTTPEVPLSQLISNEIQVQKKETKLKIEALILEVVKSIAEDRLPVLQKQRSLQNSDDVRKSMCEGGLASKIPFGGRCSRTFAKLMYAMSTVYKMIQTNQTVSMREMYYENLNFFGNQNRLNATINELTLLLKVPREILCVEASAKGLVAGSISFKNRSGEVVRASDSRHGMMIPNKLHELSIITDADCVLFIEKDAIFQRLLHEKVHEELGPIILITGKGYPDILTRRLLCILNKIHRLKIYALVDCDPYGIEIAAIVKWGPYRNMNNGHSKENNLYITSDVTVPNLEWLGLRPSEVAYLALPTNSSTELTEKDKKKLLSLTKRIQLNVNASDNDLPDSHPWLKEIAEMQRSGRKTELEALFNPPSFAKNVYLRPKLPERNMSLMHLL